MLQSNPSTVQYYTKFNLRIKTLMYFECFRSMAVFDNTTNLICAGLFGEAAVCVTWYHLGFFIKVICFLVESDSAWNFTDFPVIQHEHELGKSYLPEVSQRYQRNILTQHWVKQTKSATLPNASIRRSKLNKGLCLQFKDTSKKVTDNNCINIKNLQVGPLPGYGLSLPLR